MKIKKLNFLTLYIFFTLKIFFIQAASDKATSININFDNSKEFGPFLGYNCQIIPMNYNYDNPELFRAVKALKPAYLRFPGGSAGNFYHWKIDNFKDEDFTAEGQITFIKEAFENFKKNSTLHPDGKLGFKEFLVFCKNLGAEPIVTFNIYTEDADSLAEFIKHIKELNIVSVKYGMLGCENYMPKQSVMKFNSQGKRNIGNAEEYALTAEEAYKKIKKTDPYINLAVNIIAPKGAGLRNNEDIKWWNEELLNKNIFDAFESHYYQEPINEIFKKSDAEAKGEYYYKQWKFILFAQHADHKENLSENKKFFSKPIWQDEGGIGWTIWVKEGSTSTMMMALLDAEYIFLSSDEFPQYERVCRHNLHSGAAWQILGKYNDKVTNGFNPHPPRYQVLKLLGNINECKKRIECTIKDSSEIQGNFLYENSTMPGIDARVFEKDNTLFIYVINRGPNKEKIKIESGKKLIFPARLEYVGGYLDASNGIDEHENGRPLEHIAKIEEKQISQDKIEIIPFSLTLVTVRYQE
ncbi:MAG: hypothetical protein A2096_13665 [Spirochaetes bacterium GWF1_41_5]|nr:MAG: hypothetical protein A2096_13665 [Spirochaetes bacterium GWF1_41_5]HBE02775.1 hypothetical protein [Spirochaetia bacterium]